MTENKQPNLFYINDLCASCPRYLFDFQKKMWVPTKHDPAPGDHVVVDMLHEKVVADNMTYRPLRKSEQRLWDTVTIPTRLTVTDLRVGAADLSEQDDPKRVSVTANRKVQPLY